MYQDYSYLMRDAIPHVVHQGAGGSPLLPPYDANTAAASAINWELAGQVADKGKGSEAKILKEAYDEVEEEEDEPPSRPGCDLTSETVSQSRSMNACFSWNQRKARS